ncbi:PPC domain-containing protein [Rubrivirga sp.]|uniref:PPC domain-containing protein n=1 Tax=Rubrivirga sp. TaxID=1885344 RepID=UPI003C77B302
MTRILPLLLVAALATAGSAQTSGTISDDDPEFINGKPHDAYAVVLESGDELSITMTSTAVDTYLYLMSPSGRNIGYNDDCTQGDFEKSCLSFSAGQAGTYEVVATTYENGETGAYEIEILVNGEPAP